MFVSKQSLRCFFVVSWMSFCFLWVVSRVSLGCVWECFLNVSTSVSVVFWGVSWVLMSVYFGFSEMYVSCILGVSGSVTVVSYGCL